MDDAPCDLWCQLSSWLQQNDHFIFIGVLFTMIVLNALVPAKLLPTPLRDSLHKLVRFGLKNSLGENVVLEPERTRIISDGLYFAICMGGVGWVFFALADSVHPNITQFNLSFGASLAQDVLLFGVVGISWALLSQRNPKSEQAYRRLENLLNHEEVDDAVLRGILTQISDRLTYCRSSNIVFVFKEYEPTINAIRVESVVVREYFNTTTDINLKDRKHEFRLYTDKLNIPANIPSNHTSNAQVSALSIQHAGSSKPDYKVLSPENVSEKFERDVEIEVPGGQTFSTDIRFWVWTRLKQVYLWEFDRFTQQLNVEFRNECDNDVEIEILLPNYTKEGLPPEKTDARFRLTPGAQASYYWPSLNPREYELFKVLNVTKGADQNA